MLRLVLAKNQGFLQEPPFIGKGGGLILGVGCGVPIDAKFENLKAMIDTAREYRTGSS